MKIKYSYPFLIFFLFSCKNPNNKVIFNPQFNHQTVKEFKNIYESTIETTKYDDIDFLNPNEKAKKTYKTHMSFFRKSKGPQIDMTKGYDYKDFWVEPDLNQLKNPDSNLQITYIGHATFLIQLGKTVSILTDPHFTNLPFHWLFERLKRHAPPPLLPHDLSFVDAIVISHNHYDHLDFESLKKFDRNVQYFVPLRINKIMGNSYKNITSMDWYTETQYLNIKIGFVPAQHWSKRKPFERNNSLWGGFVFYLNDKKIYFAGDTGYSKIFQDIKQKHGSMDYCLLPIISYLPMRYRKSHLTPEQALQTASDLKCKVFIPWGHGTFTLGHEHILEPLRRLKKAYHDKNWPFKLQALKIGETLYD